MDESMPYIHKSDDGALPDDGGQFCSLDRDYLRSLPSSFSNMLGVGASGAGGPLVISPGGGGGALF